MANTMVGGIISLTLGVLLVTNVLIPTIKGANTTGWSASETAMFSLASLGAILGVGYGAFAVFGLV